MRNPNNVPPIGQSPWIKILGKGEIDYRGDPLVSSPITSACFACHDSQTAIAHFQANGGILLKSVSSITGATPGVPGTSTTDRSGLDAKNVEQCLLCHASGKIADVKVVHQVKGVQFESGFPHDAVTAASPGASPGPRIPDPGIGNASGVFLPRTPTGVPNHQESGDFMRKKWIPLAAALALLAGAAQAGAAATQDAKATPAPSASAAQGKAPTAKPPATAKKKLVNLNAASRGGTEGACRGAATRRPPASSPAVPTTARRSS